MELCLAQREMHWRKASSSRRREHTNGRVAAASSLSVQRVSTEVLLLPPLPLFLLLPVVLATPLSSAVFSALSDVLLRPWPRHSLMSPRLVPLLRGCR